MDPDCNGNLQEDEDAKSFVSQVRKNPFLAREEAYMKTNQELEKKTSELIFKLEKYSKSRSVYGGCFGGRGQGDDAGSDFGTEDGLSSMGDNFSTKGFSTSSQCDHLDHGPEGDTENERTRSVSSRTRPLNYSKSTPSLLEKMALLSSLSSEPNAENTNKEKKPSRLQRATESVIRGLHAKIANHEERLADLHLSFRHKIQENTILESKINALEEERERNLRTINTLQTIVDKHAKVAESSKSSLSIKMQAVASMKKEIGSQKKENKILNASGQTLQTRLNRALEENERLKNQIKASALNFKEAECDSKVKLETQRLRILDLEKQQMNLNSTITKQNRTIRTLRDQKVRESFKR